MPVKVYDGTNWVTVAGDGQAGAPGAAGTSSSIATWVKTASGGETSVSGTGDTGYGTLAYTVGQELVYLNGVLLDRGDDYTATNGTSITGLTALLANDVITVWTVNSFSVANTYTQAQSDARYPAKAGSVLQVIQDTADTYANTTSTTYGATGLSVTITPSSSTSKILIIANLSAVLKHNGNGSNGVKVQLSRAGSQIYFLGDRQAWNGADNYASVNVPINYLDSPATTSATTYTVEFASLISGQLASINNSATGAAQSTIIAMEIGA